MGRGQASVRKEAEMKKILVVDDEARMRRIYKALFSVEGYQVIEAPGAAEANEALKKDEIDLVLLDLRMPDVNGNILFDVMKMFHKKVQVIVSSVYHVEKQKKIVRGASDYYDKSQGIDILLRKVRRLLAEPIQISWTWAGMPYYN
jgi:DNA-binding NtrC family response regulator